jgi:hypothetical protein
MLSFFCSSDIEQKYPFFVTGIGKMSVHQVLSDIALLSSPAG